MNLVLANAERFLKLGISVIPVKPKSKEPLVNWKEFQKRRPTEAELKLWFADGAMNLGIVTGLVSNLAVVDLDGAEGLKFLRSHTLAPTVTVLSGNGRHLYYKWTDGLRNSAGKIAEGVDIRAEGGQVLAPPSLHPSGRRYRFLGSALGMSKLPEFPKELLTKTANTSETSWHTKPESWDIEALNEFSKGHVSNTLVSILGKFRAHNFSADATFAFLKPYNTSGEMSDEELKAKIDEIWGRYEPRSVPAQPSAPGRIYVPETKNTEARSIGAFLENEIQTQWLCKPFFSKPSLGFIVGLPEALKSWLAADLAIELARGGKWLGKYDTTKSRVLFIDQERALPETQRRFKALLTEKGLTRDSLSDSLFLDCSSHRKMDLDSSYESFKQEIVKIKPDVIIVDSFVTFHTKQENDRMEIQKVLDRLKVLREMYGCSTIFINHESKSAYQDAVEHNEPSAGRMVGSIGVVAAAESIISVKKVDKQSSHVYQTKNSLANPAEPFTVVVSDTPIGIKLLSV